MMNKTNLFERARAADILEVARGAGLTPKRAGPGRFVVCCPVHQEKTASCHIQTSGKFANRAHCFGCGFDGDVIDFYGALYGLETIEAARVLAGETGQMYEVVKIHRAEPVDQLADQVRTMENAQTYADFLRWCRDSEPTEQKRAGLAYLTGRGFTLETLKAGAVRIVPDDQAARGYLHTIRDRAIQAGLLRSDGVYNLSGYPLLFPSIEPGTVLVRSIQGRAIGNPATGPKYKYLPGVKKYPYGGHTIRKTDKRVFVVEGALDALAVVQCEAAAALALGGLSLPDALPGMIAGRAVILTLDNDKAGAGAYEGLSANLRGHGLTVYAGKLPETVKDAGEMMEESTLNQMIKRNPVLGEMVRIFNAKTV
jgi:DNA primase